MAGKHPSKITSLGTTMAFFSKGGCAETLFYVLDRALGHSHPIAERASTPLSGGILQHGYQCGQLWGAALAAGAEAHRRFKPGTQAQTMAIIAAQRIVKSFQDVNAATDCYDFTGIDEKSSTWQMITTFLFKGATMACVRMANRTAPALYRVINAVYEEAVTEAPEGPVSCAAMLAEKLGATDEQVTMAAGLAGGIGLSGGACGALGAAVWLTGVRDQEQGTTKVGFKSQKNLAVIERFLKVSNYEFECFKLVGRTFENASDHACHLCQGGCAKLLDALAVP